MKLFMVVPYYLYWHYTHGFTEWANNLFTFVVSEFHFFSIKDLISTLFSPFQRLKEKNTGSPVDIENILSIIVVNLVMRLLGFVVRTTILILGAITITLSTIAALFLILLWIILPVALAALLFFSVYAYFIYKP